MVGINWLIFDGNGSNRIRSCCMGIIVDSNGWIDWSPKRIPSDKWLLIEHNIRYDASLEEREIQKNPSVKIVDSLFKLSITCHYHLQYLWFEM